MLALHLVQCAAELSARPLKRAQLLALRAALGQRALRRRVPVQREAQRVEERGRGGQLRQRQRELKLQR